MAVPNLDLLRQIEEEMNRQSARLQSMQLELHRQGSDIQSLKRVAAESRAQQELEEQDEKMRASHQSMQSAMHDHLASHAAAQRTPVRGSRQPARRTGTPPPRALTPQPDRSLDSCPSRLTRL